MQSPTARSAPATRPCGSSCSCGRRTTPHSVTPQLPPSASRRQSPTTRTGTCLSRWTSAARGSSCRQWPPRSGRRNNDTLCETCCSHHVRPVQLLCVIPPGAPGHAPPAPHVRVLCGRWGGELSGGVRGAHADKAPTTRVVMLTSLIGTGVLLTTKRAEAYALSACPAAWAVAFGMVFLWGNARLPAPPTAARTTLTSLQLWKALTSQLFMSSCVAPSRAPTPSAASHRCVCDRGCACAQCR